MAWELCQMYLKRGARSATAQADYDLQAIVGAEEIARGATAVETSATTLIQVQLLDQIPTPESIGDTVDQATNRALGQRPDSDAASSRNSQLRGLRSECGVLPLLGPQRQPIRRLP